jgi:hypothetical protein
VYDDDDDDDDDEVAQKLRPTSRKEESSRARESSAIRRGGDVITETLTGKSRRTLIRARMDHGGRLLATAAVINADRVTFPAGGGWRAGRRREIRF